MRLIHISYTLVSSLCLLKLACYTGSIIFSVFALINMNYITENVSGVTRDWKNDLISRIVSNTTNITLEPYEYVNVWAGEFPGTVNGCYCTSRSAYSRVYPGLFTGNCNSNQTRMGCRNIPSNPSVALNKYIDSSEVFTVRIKNSSYLELRQKMNQTGECVEGFKLCSTTCVPVDVKSCPITKILVGSDQNPDPTLYNDQADFGNFTVYTSNSSKYETITDVTIEENAVCVSKRTRSISPGRTPYVLLDADYKSCIEDPRYERMDDGFGELTFFRSNQLYTNTSTFVNYDTGDNYKWYMFSARLVKMSDECITKQSSIDENLSRTLPKMKTAFWVLIIISWVFVGLSLFLGILWSILYSVLTWNAGHLGQDKEQMLRIIWMASWIMDIVSFLLQMTVCIIIASPAVEIYKIVTMMCFDSEVYENGYLFAKTKIMYRFLGAFVMHMIVCLFQWVCISFHYKFFGSRGDA